MQHLLQHLALHKLYSSPNIIRMIKSRSMTWVAHVARMVEKRGTCRVLLGMHEEKKSLRRPRVDGRIILRWIVSKLARKAWTGLIWHRIEGGSGLF